MAKIDSDGVFLFGKYEGETVEEISFKDPEYLYWCHHNVDDFRLKQEIEKCIEV
jgi:broad specificity phosphatase PhoE